MSETSAINEFIGSEVKSQDVVLFMKGTPGFPQCGFSGQVVQILDYLDIDYKGVNILTSDELREGIKSYSQWPTIPQLYIKGEFIGGCDIIREMFQAGELQAYLEEKGKTEMFVDRDALFYLHEMLEQRPAIYAEHPVRDDIIHHLT